MGGAEGARLAWHDRRETRDRICELFGWPQTLVSVGNQVVTDLAHAVAEDQQ